MGAVQPGAGGLAQGGAVQPLRAARLPARFKHDSGDDGASPLLVVGLPDEQWGSTVVAAVVLEPGRQPGGPKRGDGAALREAARARLDGAHAPKQVLVLEALPLRPSGKVDRREVARLLATTTTDVTSEPLTPGP